MVRRPTVLIIGTGKMGRDIGLYLFGRGVTVVWLSRDPGRLAQLRPWVTRRCKRLARVRSGLEPKNTDFQMVGKGALPGCEAVLECVEEDPAAKTAVVRQVLDRVARRPLLLSNSSSILPEEIHPRCLGMHFFYPVALSELVELVFPRSTPATTRAATLALAADWGVEPLLQDERSAHLLNRLLVPVQAACLAALRRGTPAAEVDRASRNPLTPEGQLTLIDRVGITLVAHAVQNYRRRPGMVENDEFANFYSGLQFYLRREGARLVDGEVSVQQESRPAGDLSRRLFALLVNSCLHARALGLVEPDALDRALAAVHGSQSTVDQALHEVGRHNVAAALTRRSSAPWYLPAPGLPGGVTLPAAPF